MTLCWGLNCAHSHPFPSKSMSQCSVLVHQNLTLFRNSHCSLIQGLPWVSSVQFSHSVVSDSFVTPWTPACQDSLSITNSRSLLKLMSIKSVMPCSHLILCLPLLHSVFPSIRVFSDESVLHITWPTDWTFSFSISPSSEYSGLISFRMDWLDLLAVQVTQESSPIPQFKSINSAPSFIIQLSYPYMTIGKTIALTRWTFVDKVISLLFNMLSRLVITFHGCSHHLQWFWIRERDLTVLPPESLPIDLPVKVTSQ